MSERQERQGWRRLGRRAFLRDSVLVLAGAAAWRGDPADLLAADTEKPNLRVGLLTDLHHADKPPKGNRHYRDTLAKLAEASRHFVESKADFVVEMGDIVDTAPSLDAEKECLKQMATEFARMPCRQHFVIGNHCVKGITKPDFLKIVGQERSYYSFDAGDFHFIVLDACFRGDGVPYGGITFNWPDANISPPEMKWLREDLGKTRLKTIAFVHQCLDVGSPFGVTNNLAVRKMLEDSGKAVAVIQGHLHPGNYQAINKIHYCTLSGMIEGPGPENNAYAVMDILPGDVIRITGFRKQKSYRWA